MPLAWLDDTSWSKKWARGGDLGKAFCRGKRPNANVIATVGTMHLAIVAELAFVTSNFCWKRRLPTWVANSLKKGGVGCLSGRFAVQRKNCKFHPALSLAKIGIRKLQDDICPF